MVWPVFLLTDNVRKKQQAPQKVVHFWNNRIRWIKLKCTQFSINKLS